MCSIVANLGRKNNVQSAGLIVNTVYTKSPATANEHTLAKIYCMAVRLDLMSLTSFTNIAKERKVEPPTVKEM